jgi:photoactive yellow protein
MFTLAPPIALSEVETADQAELDALPFGTIQLDANGIILKYNETEAKLARLDAKSQIGRNFFTEVAPCTRVREFYGRFQTGVAQQKFLETFTFIFNFAHGPSEVRITMMYSDTSQTMWLVVAELKAQ